MATKAQKERREKQKVSAKKMVEKRRSESGRTTYTPPPDVEFFKPKRAGTYRLNIIPFTAGKGNPFADEGELHFERTYQAHRGIGADENAYLCPRKVVNKPCCICDDRAKLAKDPDTEPDQLKALKCQDRQVWLVEDLADAGKVKIYDESLWNFGKQIEAMIQNADEGDGYEYFADPESGFTLKVGYTEESFAGRTYLKATTVEFKPRTKPLADELLSQAFCVDDMVNKGVRSSEELRKIYLQLADKEEAEEDEEPEDNSTPSKKTVKKPAPADEGDDDDETPAPKKPGKKEKTAKDLGIKKGTMVEHEDFGECEVIKVSPDGSSLTIEDEDGKEHTAVNPNDVTIAGGEDEPEEEDEAPTPKKKPGKKPEPEEDEDESDDEDEEEEDEPEEDEDEEPAPKKKGSKKPPVDEDEENEDEPEEEEEEEEDEDDDEEPAPRRKK